MVEISHYYTGWRLRTRPYLWESLTTTLEVRLLGRLWQEIHHEGTKLTKGTKASPGIGAHTHFFFVSFVAFVPSW